MPPPNIESLAVPLSPNLKVDPQSLYLRHFASDFDQKCLQKAVDMENKFSKQKMIV